jgi:hypothetical protein
MNTKKGTKYRSMAAGITSQLTSVPNVTLENTTYATADLAKLFTSIADALDAAPPLKAAWLTSARSAAAAEEKAHPVLVAFAAWVRTTYGKKAPAILQAFGLTAPAPRPATAATKAQAQVKAKATKQSKQNKQATTAAAPAATVASASGTSGSQGKS